MIIHRYSDGSEGFQYEKGDRVIVERTINGGWFDIGPCNSDNCIVVRQELNDKTTWLTGMLDIKYSDEWGCATCKPWHVKPHPDTYQNATVVIVRG